MPEDIFTEWAGRSVAALKTVEKEIQDLTAMVKTATSETTSLDASLQKAAASADVVASKTGGSSVGATRSSTVGDASFSEGAKDDLSAIAANLTRSVGR